VDGVANPVQPHIRESLNMEIVIDTSALIAVIVDEPEKDKISRPRP
jgi:hypothetical protein